MDELAEVGKIRRMSGSIGGGSTVPATLADLNDKFTLHIPGDNGGNTVRIPMVEGRLVVHHLPTDTWRNWCAYDPQNPDPPGTACAAWVKAIDFPEAIRVRIIDEASGNATLFFAGNPPADAPGLSVRIIGGGPALREQSQSITLASDHPTIVVRGEPYSRTSFGHARVAAPYTLFDGVQTYGIDPRQWGTQTATGGTVTYDTVSGTTVFAVTNASGSSAIMRTHTYFLYQAGKTMRNLITLYHNDTGQAGQVRRWGQFDNNDGLFWELNGTNLRIVRRSSVSGVPVDFPTERADWNHDKLDGFGPSGMTLDLTKGSIYESDLQWLSVGIVRFFINDILVHVMDHRNQLASPYMRTAQLPVQLEVTNTGSSTASGMRLICSAVSIDGGEEPAHAGHSRARSAIKTGIGTTFLPVLSFRVADTFLGRQNRRLILPKRVFVTNRSGRANFRIVLNGTLTGFAWNPVLLGASSVDYDETATALTGGFVMLEGYLPNTADAKEINGEDFFTLRGTHLRCPAFGGFGDIMTIAAASDVGTTDVNASAAWYEVG